MLWNALQEQKQDIVNTQQHQPAQPECSSKSSLTCFADCCVVLLRLLESLRQIKNRRECILIFIDILPSPQGCMAYIALSAPFNRPRNGLQGYIPCLKLSCYNHAPCLPSSSHTKLPVKGVKQRARCHGCPLDLGRKIFCPAELERNK